LSGDQKVRPPAVAGAFYPDEAAALRRALADSFAAARLEPVDDEEGGVRPEEAVPKALVAPHAGYVYSGPVAGSAYARLRRAAGRIERVVLLGPAHRYPLDGVAVSSADAFGTPLGMVPIDAEARDLVLGVPGVRVLDAAHAAEHSLEVHLPFLLDVLGATFRLLPLVVGVTDPAVVADVLAAVWGGPETLVVVSTDLSHYLPYEEAARLDAATAAAIVAGDVGGIADRDACGAYPLRGLLVAAARRSLPLRLLDLRSSGDTAGGRDRVVGYGAFAVG